MSGMPTVIKEPLVIIFKEPGGKIITRIHPDATTTHEHYGLIVCDLVRHVANAFRVEENAVWKWVDIERDQPTTDITEHS